MAQAQLKDVDIGRRFVVDGICYMQAGESTDEEQAMMVVSLTGRDSPGVKRMDADRTVELVQEIGESTWKSHCCIRSLRSWWSRFSCGWRR